MKNLLAITLLALATGAGYGSPREFHAAYCGVNVFGAPSAIDTNRVSTLCVGKAISPLNEGYDAVRAKFGDGSTAIYEIDDVEYVSETQKNIYVYRNNGPLYELTLTFKNVEGMERFMSIRGHLDRGITFNVYLTPVEATISEIECPYGVGLNGATGRYMSCQCPPEFPYFNSESGMCQQSRGDR